MTVVPFDHLRHGNTLKLISIHTPYVDRIRDGSKLYELRGYNPHIYPNDWCIVYETKPTMHIATAFRTNGFWCMTPDEAWDRYSERFGIDCDSYFAYFQGKKYAYGVEIEWVVNFDPIPISELRSAIGFYAPQAIRSWGYQSIHKRIIDAIFHS
jgi:predicted transcriptional regulator